jgi:hypothetical protein
MTDELPPIDPAAIRVIVHDGTPGRMVAEFPVEHLPVLVDLSRICGAMPERTPASALNAVSVYREAVRKDNGLVACAAALWICLYGDELPAQFGLQMSDLQAAAGVGVITIYARDRLQHWEFTFEDGNQRIGGRKVIPRKPHWSSHPPAGTA